MPAPVTKVGVALPTTDMASAVDMWQELLGVAPTFVDGDQWAQFDTPTGRVCLAGTDRVADGTALMLKVDAGELESTSAEFAKHGFTVGSIEVGPHERRCVAHSNGGTVVVYAPLPHES